MLNHEAIYSLYSNAVCVDDEKGVFDANGNQINIDLVAVKAWVDNQQYKENRKQAYPSIVDQLDTLYHGGFDAWKATIDAVKNQFPKP